MQQNIKLFLKYLIWFLKEIFSSLYQFLPHENITGNIVFLFYFIFDQNYLV